MYVDWQLSLGRTLGGVDRRPYHVGARGELRFERAVRILIERHGPEVQSARRNLHLRPRLLCREARNCTGDAVDRFGSKRQVRLRLLSGRNIDGRGCRKISHAGVENQPVSAFPRSRSRRPQPCRMRTGARGDVVASGLEVRETKFTILVRQAGVYQVPLLPALANVEVQDLHREIAYRVAVRLLHVAGDHAERYKFKYDCSGSRADRYSGCRLRLGINFFGTQKPGLTC